LSLGLVILVELCAEPARFHANNRVHARVESLKTVEYFKADQIFFQPVLLAKQTFFHHKLEKTPNPVRVNEDPASEDSLQLGADLGDWQSI